jgi:hypothetical protein
LLDNGDRRQRFTAVIKLGVFLAVLSGIFVGAHVTSDISAGLQAAMFF